MPPLLGRISAVLSANTTDFSRQIGTAGRDLARFAQQARGLQFNLDNRALNQTLTTLQRQLRTIREIENLQRQGLGAGLPDPQRLRGQLAVYEDLGKLVAGAAKQIEGLSNTAQASLYPALQRIQAGFQDVYQRIGSGASTLAQEQRRIDALRNSYVALSRALAAVGDFDGLAGQLNANNAGGSFYQARAKDAMKQALELRKEAEKIAAPYRTDAFADIAVAAEEAAGRLAVAVGKMTRLQLSIARQEAARGTGNANPRAYQARPGRQQEVNEATVALERLNRITTTRNRAASIAQLGDFSGRPDNAINGAIDRLGNLKEEVVALNNSTLDGLFRSAQRVVYELNAGTASAEEAKAALDRLNAALDITRSNGLVSSLAGRNNAALYTDRDRDIRRRREIFEKATAGAGVGSQAYILADFERQIAKGRTSLQYDIAPMAKEFAEAGKKTGNASVIAQAEQYMKNARRIDSALTKATTATTAGDYANATKYIDRAVNLLRQQAVLESQIREDIEGATVALKQQELFRRAAGTSSDKLTQSGVDLAADVESAYQYIGQIGDGAARSRLKAIVDDRAKKGEELIAERVKVAADKSLSDADKATKIDALDKDIRGQSADFADMIAKESNGAFKKGQIEAGMKRNREARGGSLSTKGFASAQLAFQQGLFAIDDLVSSTGGLEYKLRAVGNNITQLGLLLGQSGLIQGLSATTGLAIGLAAVLGGQLVLAALRYATAAEETENKAKGFKDSLSQQKNLSNAVAQNMKSLADTLTGDIFSPAASSAQKFADALRDIAKAQREANEASSILSNGLAGTVRGDRERLQKKLEGAQTAGQVIGAQAELDSNARTEAFLKRQNNKPITQKEIDRLLQENFDRANTYLVTKNPLAELFDEIAGFGEKNSISGIQAVRNSAGAIGLNINTKDLAGSLDNVRGEIQALAETAGQSVAGVVRTGAANTANPMLQNLKRVEEGLMALVSFEKYFRDLEAATKSLSIAQSNAAKAVEAGDVTGLRLQTELDSIAKKIEESKRLIEKANEDFEKGTITPGDRVRIFEREEARVADLRAEAEKKRLAASEAAFAAAVDPQNTLSGKINRIRGNNGGAFVDRELRSLEEARRQLDADISQFGSSPEREAALAAFQGIADNLEVVSTRLKQFATVLEQAASESASNLQDARRREEETRRAVTAPDATALERGAAGRAESDFRRQRELDNRVQDEVAKARAEIERDPRFDPQLTRIRDINRELDSGAANPARQQELIDERRRLQNQIDSQVELAPGVRAARDASNADAELQKRRERGIALSYSPAEQAGIKLGNDLRDLQTAFEADQGKGRGGFKGFVQDQERLIREAVQATAPAIMSMSDQVATAVLQGPSRAALQVADANTVQGAAELSRLMRGDDQAKNQDLVELQRQSKSLEELVQIARENGAPPGVFDR